MERLAATFFLLLVSHGTARASEEPGPQERAAARLEAGNQRLEAGDFAGAAAEYRAGYALYPRANLLFNIGVAELRQDHLLEAAAAFDGVLARPETTPEVAAQARQQLDRIHERLTRVEVKVGAAGGGAGAVLEIDNERRGTLPLAGPVRVLPGTHALRASKPGYRPFERQLSGAPGEEVDVTIAALEPLPPPPKTRRRYWLWGTVGAAAVTAVVIGVLATRKSDGMMPLDPIWNCSQSTACVKLP